jgi:hypothetical protein
LPNVLGYSIKGKEWVSSVGKMWNAYRVLMGHLTKRESLEELNADENVVTI